MEPYLRTKAKTIKERFEAVVNKFPDRPAVQSAHGGLTYLELNFAADELSRHLGALGIRRGDKVLLLLARSEWAVIAMLAAAKRGICYVPVDPSFPRDRIALVSKDSGCKAVLVEYNTADRAPENACLIRVDEMEREADSPTVELSSAAQPPEPEDLLYLIYTSGSTGRPKGCAIRNRNVLALINNTHQLFEFSEADVWLCLASFSFDFSVWEIYGALLHGAKVVIANETEVKDISRLPERIRGEGITVLNQTPAAFCLLLESEHGLIEEWGRNLRTIIFGGDKMPFDRLKPWFDVFPNPSGPALVNMYGITETTVHSTFYRISREDVMDRPEQSVIGKGLPGWAVTVRNPAMQEVGIEERGELYIGGAGVCQGYHDRPELTAERFLPDPECPGNVIYRTGDLAYRRDDGELVYVGRNDHQIQVRGFRVEPGEIENELKRFPGITHCLVMGIEGGDSIRLAAYFVTDQGFEVETAALQRHAEDRLPQHLIPTYFIHLEEFPLSANGKIDRNALPPPADRKGETGGFLDTEDLSPMESKLSELWKEVLGTENLLRGDDFLRVGGDSLRAIRVLGMIRSRLGKEVDLKTFMENRTISGLASILEDDETPAHRVGRIPRRVR